MDKKNKKPGLMEIIMGILIFVGFPFVGNFLSNFVNLDLPLFSYAFYGVYILGFILFLVGLVKMTNKKNKINTENKTQPIKKQNPLWLLASLILILVGFIIFYLGLAECKISREAFCELGVFFILIPFVSIGVFILFIYFIRKLTRHK